MREDNYGADEDGRGGVGPRTNHLSHQKFPSDLNGEIKAIIDSGSRNTKNPN